MMYNRSGVVFSSVFGRNQETKYGNPRAYDNIDGMFNMFSFQGAYANARPRNRIGEILAKLGNIIAAWETGNYIGNEFNTSKPENLFSPPFSFTGAPAVRQLHSSTISNLMGQYMNSSEYWNRSGHIGVDTVLKIMNDTILPIQDKIYPHPNRDELLRKITPLPPRLR